MEGKPHLITERGNSFRACRGVRSLWRERRAEAFLLCKEGGSVAGGTEELWCDGMRLWRLLAVILRR